MSYNIQFAPEALDQLDAIEDYIAHAGSPLTAAHYIDAIVAYCESLVTILGVFYGGQDYEAALQDASGK